MFRRLSLLWKIWLSTSVVLTGMFAFTALLVNRYALETTSRSMEEEAAASFQAYESVWKTRAQMLGSVASMLSSMPHVRAAFVTRDAATIREQTAGFWAQVSDDFRENAFFVVTDPEGESIATLDRSSHAGVPADWPVVRSVRAQFPQQISGFFVYRDELFQLVLTPVYARPGATPVLLNVLVAGYSVNSIIAQQLKESTGGSEFLFLSQGRVFASTLNDRATGVLTKNLAGVRTRNRISDGISEYALLERELVDVQNRAVGQLVILRSFDAALQNIAALRRNLILLWLLAISGGLALTWSLARRIVKPVETLDLAAAEIARQNYAYRVSIDSGDEIGRLARTFNSMCASIQAARQELIKQERITTIGRMASSIVHDLRNPLAAIYGGAEMLLDSEVPESHKNRLAANIFRAARRIQGLLQDLLDVSKGRAPQTEMCDVREVIETAIDSARAAIDAQGIKLEIEMPEGIELPLERGRVERVFLNLIGNAIEVMPNGGEIRIRGEVEEGSIVVDVEDSGPGISEEIRPRLFEPFVTYGKRNGLGLGLALSRQTMLDHGGDMWASESRSGSGARFCLRFPYAPSNITMAAGE
ncbi:MAG: ATP-binding protein [Bryobacteraceae bacterium]